MRRASAELQYAVDETADACDLVGSRRRVPLEHLREGGRHRLAQVDELEQAMHRVADLRRREPCLAGADGPLRPQPGDALDVVAIRAAIVQRQRGVGEPPHPVQRRRARAGRAPAGDSRAAAESTAAGSAANSSSCARRPPRRRPTRRPSTAASPASSSPPRSTRSRKRASPRASSTGSAAASTSACAASRPSTQPIGVSRSWGRSGSIAPDTMSRSTARVIAT